MVEEKKPKAELSLLPSGLIRMFIDGEDYLLRRPRGGEFKKLAERLAELREEDERRATEINADPEKLRRVLYQGQHADDLVLDWVKDVFGMLCEKALPADADMPPWFENAVLPSRFLAHWREIPLAPSAR
jgi:hypothetical protein